MKSKIFSICEELVKKGVKPTLESVRSELGGGSFSTINPILKEWKESQASKPAPVVAIPEEAAKAIEQATALVWTLATEHHNEALNAIRSEASKIEQAAIFERDEAMAEIQALEEHIKQQESNVAEQEALLTALNSDNSEKLKTIDLLRQEAEKQQIRLDNAEKMASKAETQAEKLNEQVKDQAETINALKLELATQKLTIDAKTQLIQEQQTEIKALKSELKQAATDAKAQAKEINSFSLQNQKLQTALDSSSKDSEKAKAELKEARKDLMQAQSEAAKLAGMLEVYSKTSK